MLTVRSQPRIKLGGGARTENRKHLQSFWKSVHSIWYLDPYALLPYSGGIDVQTSFSGNFRHRHLWNPRVCPSELTVGNSKAFPSRFPGEAVPTPCTRLGAGPVQSRGQGKLQSCKLATLLRVSAFPPQAPLPDSSLLGALGPSMSWHLCRDHLLGGKRGDPEQSFLPSDSILSTFPSGPRYNIITIIDNKIYSRIEA